jgi:hypothetical protein
MRAVRKSEDGNGALSGMGRRAAAVGLLCALIAAANLLVAGGCGERSGSAPEELRGSLAEAAVRFLNACMEPDPGTVLDMLTLAYREENGVPPNLTREELLAVEGTFVGYYFDPATDILLQESGRHLVMAELDYALLGKRRETVVLVEEGGWRVDGFTAFDWSALEGGEDPQRAQAEKQLRLFLDACLRSDTDYIFRNLTDAYKREYRLAAPWTAAEFSGIFGSARGYEIESGGIRLVREDQAEADVTIVFGSHGNLEEQTSRVIMLRQGGTWKVDAFPFFVY